MVQSIVAVSIGRKDGSSTCYIRANDQFRRGVSTMSAHNATNLPLDQAQASTTQ